MTSSGLQTFARKHVKIVETRFFKQKAYMFMTQLCKTLLKYVSAIYSCFSIMITNKSLHQNIMLDNYLVFGFFLN